MSFGLATLSTLFSTDSYRKLGVVANSYSITSREQIVGKIYSAGALGFRLQENDVIDIHIVNNKISFKQNEKPATIVLDIEYKEQEWA